MKGIKVTSDRIEQLEKEAENVKNRLPKMRDLCCNLETFKDANYQFSDETILLPFRTGKG